MHMPHKCPEGAVQHDHDIKPAQPRTTRTMTAAVTSSRMMAQHIHFRVFFCSCLAPCSAVVPLCTYSTLRETCRHKRQIIAY